MSEIQAPSWAVFDTNTKASSQVVNKYDESVKTESDKENAYTIEAPEWAVFEEDKKTKTDKIIDNESELDLHHNTERRKTPNIPKTWTGTSYDELNPEGWGAWVYGWNASQEGMYELLNNIPGSIDRFFDWAGEKTGLDKDDEGFLEESLQNLEYWLTKRARLTNPEYLGLEAPETFKGKLFSALGSVPVTLAQYVPLTMITRNPVLGFGLTDAIRAAEPDASLWDIGLGFAHGAVLGKTLKWASNYGVTKRVAIMGAAGYGSTWLQTHSLEPPPDATEEEKKAFYNGLSQDRWVNALVMGGLGIPGRYLTGAKFKEGVKKEFGLEGIKEDIPFVKTKAQINKDQVNKDLDKIKTALEKGEYNPEIDTLIRDIVQKVPEAKLDDIQLIQNIKDYAENIKRVEERVNNDVAKEDFSIAKFEAAVKDIAKRYGVLEAQYYYNKYLEAKGFKPEVKVESDIIIPENIKVGDTIEVFDIAGNKYKTKVTAKDETSGSIKVKNQQGQEVVVNQNASATTVNIRSPNYKFDTVKVPKPINELSKKELELIKEKLESQQKIFEDANVTNQLDYITIIRDLNAVKLRLKEGQKPPVTTTETKPLHKILKVNEKVLNERLSKKEKDLEIKEIEPKTVTFNEAESIYFNINKEAFKNAEARTKNDGADVVLPIIQSLPKYKSYLKNLKKSLTDIFGKTFDVYRLMDRSEFEALSTKGVNKPLSVSLDKTIVDKGAWGIGKSKLERAQQAQNENIVFPGSLKINEPVLVRLKVDAKSVLARGDKTLAEIIVDGKKVNSKNVELIQDNTGIVNRKLTETDIFNLEDFQFRLETYVNRDFAFASRKYNSIEPIIYRLHEERAILESMKRKEYPKSEIDTKTGELKPIKTEEVVNFNDHINNLINRWITEGSKDNFIEFLNTLPSRKSRFKFPEEQQPVKSFMLVPWLKEKLNLLKLKDTKYLTDELKLLTNLTKYLAKVDSVFKRDSGKHSNAMNIIRAAERGDVGAMQQLISFVHSFKIADWVLDNGKLYYKIEAIPFKGDKFRNIPLRKETVAEINRNEPLLMEEGKTIALGYLGREVFRIPTLIEVGRLHAGEIKFDGKQGSFVGKLKGKEWLKHQEKEFKTLIENLQKTNILRVQLTDKLSKEDPLDYKGTIPDPTWTKELYGQWRITEYEKGKNKYNRVITKVKIDPVPKDSIATETRTSKLIEVEELKNVIFENKKIEDTKLDIISPDAQRLAIEQKRVELDVKEDGNVTITRTRKRKSKLSDEDISIIDNRLKQIERLVDTARTTVTYAQRVADNITGRFTMTKEELLIDLVDAQGNPKYVNKRGEDNVGKLYLNFASWMLPPRFMKKNPALGFASQKIGDFMNKIDREMEYFIWKLGHKHLSFGEFDKSAKGKSVFTTGKIPIGLTLGSRYASEPTNGGMITRLYNMNESKEIINGKKGWERADEVAQTFFKVQRDKKTLSEKENLPYDMKNKDGTFRYEVTDFELKNTYKLDAEQILAFRDVRNVLNTLVNLYNAKVLKYGKLNNVSVDAVINPLPNYVPGMFFGDARIFVNRKGQVEKAQKGEIKWEDLEVVEAKGKNNRAEAEIFIRTKEFKEKYPNANIYVKIGDGNRVLKRKGTGDYDVTIYMVDREIVAGTTAYEAINQFAEATRWLTKKGRLKEAELMEQAKQQLQASRGFPIHRLKKQNVKGAMGERFGKTAKRQDVVDLMKGLQAYTEGLLRTTYGWEFRNDMMGRNSILRATQMTHYPHTRSLINRMIDGALGHTTNKFDKATHNLLRKWIGERGMEKFFGYGNVFGLSTSLLFFNVRFMESQAIQPLQMMVPKLRSLIRQKKLFSNNPNGEGLLMDAVVRAGERMVRPQKEDFELIDYLYKEGVLEAKFFQEFLGKEATSQTHTEIKGKQIPIWSFAKNTTMKSFVGKLESNSRLSAALMVYHLLRLSGRSKKFSQSEAASISDKYMVQYALHDRALIFSSAGLGLWAKPVGLFKTFLFNYLAQAAEHIQLGARGVKKFAKKEQGLKDTLGDLSPSAYFLSSMVLTAGLYGIIAIEQADAILKMLKKETLTEKLAKSDLPQYLLWGIPSDLQGVDLTTTLAAPSLGVSDIFSVVALDKLGLNPLKGLDNEGLAQGFVNVVAKALDSNATATRADMQKFYKGLLPTSLHGWVEFWYSGYGKLPVLNERKEYGTFNRDFKDWWTRLLMSSRSIKEANRLKRAYAQTLLNKRLDKSLATAVNSAADLVVRGIPIPAGLWIKVKEEYNVLPKDFNEMIKNRLRLVLTTLDDRDIPKGGKISGRWLLEREIMGGTMNDKSRSTGEGTFYNFNQHTNQIEAPDWAVFPEN